MAKSEPIAAVVEYYEAKLALFGSTARGVDWKDERSQLLRFEQLIRALRLDGRTAPFTLIDFGCGYGALRPFLERQRFTCTYVGYDRSLRMVEEARREFGSFPRTTFTSDWEDLPHADYVVASGVFNVRLSTSDETWRHYVLDTMAGIDEKAERGWAVNFLTAYADEDRKRADLHYASPQELFDWCLRSASSKIALLHDYGLYEFTIGITRQSR
ncbi:MAG: class I SAM-dependent methyltransferase [Acidobacteriota bacterium]